MRIFVMMIVMMFFVAGWARAAMIDLTDGRSVQGTILKEDAKSLQVSVDGVAMTYYADEIKDVDGKPFGVQPKQVTAQANTALQPATATNPIDTQSVNPDKKALILKFIDVFGTRQALTNNFELMLKQIAKEKPDEAQKIRERVKVDEIIDRLIPIYDRNFTTDDLNAFIGFYDSPQGHKLIATIPELMKESVQESVKYMEEKFPEAKQGK